MKLISSVLFLIVLTSMASALKIKPKVNKTARNTTNSTNTTALNRTIKSRLFVMRSEWDDRCVAYVQGKIVLVKDCQMEEAVWKTKSKGFAKVTITNYKNGKYLGFIAGNKNPQLFAQPNNGTYWKFNALHKRNTRWPLDQSYWNISYHTVENFNIHSCLTVDGDNLYQLKCMPAKPEALSFEVVKLETIDHNGIKKKLLETNLSKTRKVVGTPLVFPPKRTKNLIVRRPCKTPQ
jgi:hypothetical protein